MKTKAAFSIVLTALLAAGCATYNDRAAADRALETALRAEMNRYGDLAANAPNVHFDANGGAVTLSGTVRTEKDRELLNTLVRNTAGVAVVNDDLRVLTPTGLGPARVYSEPVPVQPAPVYTVTPPAGVSGATVVVPSAYPNLRMLSANSGDELVARHIGEQLALDRVAARSLQNVSVTVMGENAYLQGQVDSQSVRRQIVSSVSRASGVKAVYDQLQVR